MAAIEALRALKRPCRVTLSTDSRYVMDGLTRWIKGWQKNGWKTADRKPVKNADLWIALLEAAGPHRIEWVWVKGHAGHPDNERADKLASDAALAGGALEPPRRIALRVDFRHCRIGRAAVSSAAASLAAAGAVWMPNPPCPAHQKKPGTTGSKP